MTDKWKHGVLAETYHVETSDGAWQEISIPEGVSCKVVLIQVHDTDDTIYDPEVACIPFLYTHDETKGWTVIPKLGIHVNIRNSGRASAIGVIGKVKAATGYHVSILIIE